MSGPKALSVQVYNSLIREICKLQGEVRLREERLASLKVEDAELGVSINSDDFLNEVRSEQKNLLEFKGEKYRESIKQGNRATAHLNTIKKFIQRQAQAEATFAGRKEDYNAYREYRETKKEELGEFAEFKNSVHDVMISSSPEKSEELKNAQEKLERIEARPEEIAFSHGFREEKEEALREMRQEISGREKEVHALRLEWSRNLLASGAFLEEVEARAPQEESRAVRSDPRKQEEARAARERLRKFIDEELNGHERRRARERLEKLELGSNRDEEYFYRELLEEVRENSLVLSRKRALTELLADANDVLWEGDVVSERDELRRELLSVLERKRVTQADLQNYENVFSRLKEKNDSLALERYAAAERNEYARRSLVAALEKLNYEVLEDSQVVDFEKETDFILQVPRQENFLNLRFTKDGMLRYNFLIPEERDRLSSEMIRGKLADMETACGDFKKVLDELVDSGLKLTLEKDVPISEAALHQAPAHVRDKIEQARRMRREKESGRLKQRYLDD